MLVVGPAGVGKTVGLRALAYWLLRDAWNRGEADAGIVRGVWTTALELTRALRETRLGAPCEAFHEAQTARILFLDEIGAEPHDPRWLLDLLDALIFERRSYVDDVGVYAG